MKPLTYQLHRAINATIWSSFLLVANAFLFSFTKSADWSEISNTDWVTSPLQLFFVSWYFFAACGAVLLVAEFLILLPLTRLVPRIRWSRVFHLVPSFFLAATIFAIIDHFTFISFQFSSITHDYYAAYVLVLRLAYALGFLLLLIACFRSTLRRIEAKQTKVWPLVSYALPASAITVMVCVLAVQHFYVRSLPRAEADTLASMPNIMIITLESGLADVSSAYGPLAYDTTPFLRTFAAESIRAENHVSNAFNSRESLNTIMSGLHPYQHHGITTNHVIPETVSEMNLLNLLNRRGFPYYIQKIPGSALSEYDMNFATEPLHPFFLRFREEHFVIRSILHMYYQRFFSIAFNRLWPESYPGVETARSTIQHASSNKQPFFIHIHANQSHGDYDHCSKADLDALKTILPSITKTEELCYLLKLKEADAYMETFYTLLREEGVLENTIFLILADHPIHLTYTFDTTDHFKRLLRLPFLLRLPQAQRAGEVLQGTVQSLDVLPTILDALGLEPPPWGAGTSILPSDFERIARLRPVLIDQGHTQSRGILICNWLLSQHRESTKAVTMDDFVMTPYIRANCEKNELPRLEDIVEQIHALQWTEGRKFP